MNRDPFYVSLWIGALVLAGNPHYDPFPAELHELAERYFRRFPPIARA
jgi:hypothetical protein